jgi:putative addiction module component (TIGR02574 family)
MCTEQRNASSFRKRYIKPMTAEQLNQILRLSVQDRLDLIEEIWDSLAESPESLPVTDAQRRELDRRLAEHKKDPSSGRSWEEVRASLDGDR